MLIEANQKISHLEQTFAETIQVVTSLEADKKDAKLRLLEFKGYQVKLKDRHKEI